MQETGNEAPEPQLKKVTEERKHADSGREKPHRAEGSPALCGLKLLCEFSQARARDGNRERRRKRRKKRKERKRKTSHKQGSY